MGPRFIQTCVIARPTFNAFGDRVLASGVAVSGAVWHRRLKAVIGATGDLHSITAQGFLAKTSDVRIGDQLTVSGTDQRYDVVTVISGYDDRNVLDHVGVELRDI